MQKFKVLRRVDAWIDYLAEVEAESAVEASKIARSNQAAFVWSRCGDAEFQQALFVTLDDDGGELSDTMHNRG